MAGIMLCFMLRMYRSKKGNIGIFVGSVLVLVGAIWLVRSQAVRVCELAVEIIEAQRREVTEMEWFIADIDESGAAATPAEAEARPVP